MKLTKSKLKRMIKEELGRLAEVYQDSIGGEPLKAMAPGQPRDRLVNWIAQGVEGLEGLRTVMGRDDAVPLEALRMSMDTLDIGHEYLNAIIAQGKVLDDAALDMKDAYAALEAEARQAVGRDGR